jgi:phage/plasmid-like protein (TIGR03299 family)
MHELTIRADGKTEMAFVGETPWHHLGQNVTKGAPISVWRKEAGMDWTAREAMPMFDAVGLDMGRKVSNPLNAPEYKVLYRSDNADVLSIVGKDYNVVQPADMLEFFRDLTEGGGWHIHTAGTMRGGRKLWAMATCEDSMKYVRNAKSKDGMSLNLLLATSMDGTMQTTAMLTTVRVVCANTLRMALAAGDGYAQVKLSHRSTFDAAQIKAILGVDAAHVSFEHFMEQARELAETPIDLSEARDVLVQVFKPSASVAKNNLSWLTASLAQIDTTPEVADARGVGRVLELFDGAGMGADLATAKGTKWGLLNAVTQYVDHEMGRTPDTRLDAAWFGRGRDFKQQTLELLTEAE